MPTKFGLQVSSFTWSGGPHALGSRLRDIAQAAEEVGFSSLWVMDHLRQIPVLGPDWHDMLDSYTTLGYLAAATREIKLGTMVTGVTYRNVAHLGKIIATLDVLSGGRAICGIGAAWFEREHVAYGWDFPPAKQRLDMLEDALQVLPLLWGSGTPSFIGKVINVPETMCYPRPLQEKVPILVGGSGERRTLKLVAQYADACNLNGDADLLRHKLGILHKHCETVGRDPESIEVTHMSSTLVVDSQRDVDDTMSRLRPKGVDVQTWNSIVNAGTIDDHIDRYRSLAAAGMHTAVLGLTDLNGPAEVERFAPVIAALA